MKKTQGKKHKIETYETHKISLSCFDDKGFVLHDGIHTLAYFHKKIDSYRWSKVKRDSYKRKRILQMIKDWHKEK